MNVIPIVSPLEYKSLVKPFDVSIEYDGNNKKLSSHCDDLDPLIDLHVIVIIKRIRVVSSQSFDLESKPDLYVNVIINENKFRSETFFNADDVRERWEIESDVPDNVEEVEIRFEVFDEDEESNLHCDISGTDLDCIITYNLKYGTWQGDDEVYFLLKPTDKNFLGHTSGAEDENINEYDCEIWFEVHQNDYDNDNLTYWQELNLYETDPTVKNDRYAIIVWGAARNTLKQDSLIFSYDPPKYSGTYLLAGDENWTDYNFTVDFRSVSGNMIGFMFRYQNRDNYYRLRWDGRGGFTNTGIVLDKIINGTPIKVTEKRENYKRDEWHTIKIFIEGNKINVYEIIDKTERLLLSAIDDSISHGKIALYCWANPHSYFDDIIVEKSNGEILFNDSFTYIEYRDNVLDKWTPIVEGEYFRDSTPEEQWTFEGITCYTHFRNECCQLFRILTLAADYSPDNIYFLSVEDFFDADGDGINDIDALANKKNLKHAITDWLPTRLDSNDLCLIYFFNHGSVGFMGSIIGRGAFVVDSKGDGIMSPLDSYTDYYYAAELSHWFKTISNYHRFSFIYEACFAGTCIHAGGKCHENNIIITTSDKDHAASEITEEEWPAFSHLFFVRMADGATNMTDAFNYASSFVRNENYASIKAGQKPWLNDNGDRIGHTNDLPNNDGEGLLASKTGL